MNRNPRMNSSQRGMVLVSSLLLLVVVTILAIGLFRSFGMDEKIVGNTVSNVNCSGMVTAPASVQVCSNTLPTVAGSAANIAVLPWNIAGAAVGVNYTPPNMKVATGAGITAGTYYTNPVFYISYLGVGTGSNGAQGNVYQIDAAGYGGSPDTAAVVESTYILQTADQDLTGN